MIIALRLVEIGGVRGEAKQPGRRKHGLEQAKGTEKDREGNPQRRRD